MATRFAEVSEEAVTILVQEGVPQKPKEATSYAVRVFEGKETFNFFLLVFFQSCNVFDELKCTYQENITTNKS
jgi:hypothetical protein